MSGPQECIYMDDAYPEWREKVREATWSVVIFAPFFDGSLVSLLRNARIKCNNIKVVTNFLPSVFTTHPRQLQATLKLLEMGIEVKTLPQLHAKVLWVDGSLITIGSQDFTTQGRKNKEATTDLSKGITDSERLALLRDLIEETEAGAAVSTGQQVGPSAVLEGWLEESETVDVGLAESLAASLEVPFKGLKKKTDEIARVSRDAIELHKQTKIDLSLSLTRLIKASELANFWEGKWLYCNGVFGKKRSDRKCWNFRVLDQRDDLLDLLATIGEPQLYKAGRLHYWPLVIASTGKMYFARIGKSRITNVSEVLERGDAYLSGLINGKIRVVKDVRISFPEVVINGCNTVVSFECHTNSRPFSVRYEGRFRFDGESFEFLDGDFLGGQLKEETWQTALIQLRVLCEEYLTQNSDEVFEELLGHFKYRHQLSADDPTELWNQLGNPEHARLSIISYAGKPVFVIETEEEHRNREMQVMGSDV